MEYADAIKQTEEFLAKFAPPGHTVKIYDYADGKTEYLIKRPYAGVRVAEMSMFTSRGGISWMQSDVPDGLAVCAQIERCILSLVEDWSADGNDDGNIEFDRLAFLMAPKEEVDLTKIDPREPFIGQEEAS